MLKRIQDWLGDKSIEWCFDWRSGITFWTFKQVKRLRGVSSVWE